MVREQGEKMSKSLGNLVFVGDLVRRASGEAVRIMLAMHHFRASWDYDEDELHAAEARRLRYVSAMAGGGVLGAAEAREYERQFLERIDDDLDTPGALRVLDLAAAALARERARDVASDAVRGEDLMQRLLATIGVRLRSGVA